MDGIVITGQNLGTGSGSLSNFATQVAEKKQQVAELEQQLTGPNAQNLTPAQLSDYAKQLAAVKQQLEDLQSQCPADDTADMAQIVSLESTIATLSAVVASYISGESTITTKKKEDAKTESSGDPQVGGSSGGTLSKTDQPNLFLASSFMAILWKVEAAMIHQSIQNMDQERICKIHGYQNIMEFGNAQAQAAYNSDMDQAKMYMVQFYQAIASAAITGFTAMGGIGRQGKIERENEQLRDNPAYTQRREELKNKNPDDIKGKDKDLMEFKNGSYDKDYYKKPLPKVLDKNGKEIKPGRKQIQEEMEYADKYNYGSVTDPKTKTVIYASNDPNHPNKVKDQKRMKEAYDDNKVAIETSHYRLTNDQTLNMWKQTLPQLGQSITQAYAAFENYKFSVDKANQDYQKLLWETALQVAHSYLDNASQCFQGELQNVQQVVEFLMQAAQKNTQWASIRA